MVQKKPPVSHGACHPRGPEGSGAVPGARSSGQCQTPRMDMEETSGRFTEAEQNEREKRGGALRPQLSGVPGRRAVTPGHRGRVHCPHVLGGEFWPWMSPRDCHQDPAALTSNFIPCDAAPSQARPRQSGRRSGCHTGQ